MTSTATTPDVRPRAAIPQRTLRTDRWWLAPLSIAGILLFFVAYTTVRLFMNKWYWVDDYHYLTPVYSPCLSESCVPGSAHFGTPFGNFPRWVPLPVLIFPILAGFRATCYYYRKAGFRSLWGSPVACAVKEPHSKYTGESRFPLVALNYHRYFFYGASVLLLVNMYDAIMSFRGSNGSFGIGLGSLIITLNVVMLTLYSLSCHACRHVFGGKLKHFSKNPIRYKIWNFVSALNPKHGTFAMTSLFTVIGTDMYIMAVSAGWISDFRIFN